MHQQETIAAKIIVIPAGAADQDVEFYYQPKDVTIWNDTSLTWVNHDSAIHTATADKGSFDTGIIPIDANATVIINGSGKLRLSLDYPSMDARNRYSGFIIRL